MSTLAAISIDNDLTACKTCVSVGTTNDEFTSGVHVVFDVRIEEFKYFLGMYLLFYTWNKDVDHIILDLCQHFLIIVKFIVLCAHHNGVDTLRYAIVAVLYRHLTLSIGTEIDHYLAFLADIG